MAKSKQSAESKQTADMLKNLKFSYLTTLYSIKQAISAFILLYLTNLARRRSQISSIDSLRAMALARKKSQNDAESIPEK